MPGRRGSEWFECNMIYGIDEAKERVPGEQMRVDRNQTALANRFWRLPPSLDARAHLVSLAPESDLNGPSDAHNVERGEANSRLVSYPFREVSALEDFGTGHH